MLATSCCSAPLCWSSWSASPRRTLTACARAPRTSSCPSRARFAMPCASTALPSAAHASKSCNTRSRDTSNEVPAKHAAACCTREPGISGLGPAIPARKPYQHPADRSAPPSLQWAPRAPTRSGPPPGLGGSVSRGCQQLLKRARSGRVGPAVAEGCSWLCRGTRSSCISSRLGSEPRIRTRTQPPAA